MQNFLIIQTAFTGDVILATTIVEKLHAFFPQAKIDVVVRFGNEVLVRNNPHINQLFVWNKKQDKYKNLFRIIKAVRKVKYDRVVNVHRFFSSGMLAFFSKAHQKAGFNKNPFSFCYSRSISHKIEYGVHEIDRNNSLIADITDESRMLPKLYPSENEKLSTAKYQGRPYICMAPASIWFTKQFPLVKWIDFLNKIDHNIPVFLLGGTDDHALCEKIAETAPHPAIINLAGELSLIESVCLIAGAMMNFVNDSAPAHMASAMNAPVTMIYCSTSPDFGFGPLSTNSKVVEARSKLTCKPCGLHGYAKCPEGHFRCAMDIDTDELSQRV